MNNQLEENDTMNQEQHARSRADSILKLIDLRNESKGNNRDAELINKWLFALLAKKLELEEVKVEEVELQINDWIAQGHDPFLMLLKEFVPEGVKELAKIDKLHTTSNDIIINELKMIRPSSELFKWFLTFQNSLEPQSTLAFNTAFRPNF